MKKRNFLLFLLANLALSLQTARADNDSFNVQFIGTIVGESCNVDTGSVEQTVELGDFTADDFPSVGTTTPDTKFDITLKGCTRAITGTKVWFTGNVDANNPTLLALSDNGKGTPGRMATGLGVELLIPIAPQYRSIIRSPRFIRCCRGITRSRFICTINPRCPL